MVPVNLVVTLVGTEGSGVILDTVTHTPGIQMLLIYMYFVVYANHIS